MPILETTAGASDANAYVTVSEASSFLTGSRLYTAAWSNASTEPNGDGYLVDGAVSLGATQIAVDTGDGSLIEDSYFQFAGHSTVYKVEETLHSERTELNFIPALTANVADDEVITRLTANEQELAIIWATALIDMSMDWSGRPVDETQALRWPRTGAYDVDGFLLSSTTVPQEIKRGTSELAMSLLQRDRTEEPALFGLGFSEARVDVLQVVVDKTAALALIPKYILVIVEPVGELKPSADSGDRIMRITRS